MQEDASSARPASTQGQWHRAPPLHSKKYLVMDPKRLVYTSLTVTSQFMPYGEHKESLPGEACALGASGHW